jgi:hypothetical protein
MDTIYSLLPLWLRPYIFSWTEERTKAHTLLSQSLSLSPPAHSPNTTPSRHIGQGQCGIVLQIGDNLVLKLPNPHGCTKETLYNDAQVHALVSHGFSSLPREINSITVPQYQGWITPTHPFWSTPLAPTKPLPGPAPDVELPNDALLSSVIPPLPLPIRHALITTFFPPNIHASALANPVNEHCLIRPYLGCRRPVGATDKPFWVPTARRHLRNFPLYIDDMERLNIDPIPFARAMAQALAVLHWKVGVDGDDVEFVLGGISPHPSTAGHDNSSATDPDAITPETLQDLPQDSPEHDNLNLGLHTSRSPSTNGNSNSPIKLYLLDFNQCSRLPSAPIPPTSPSIDSLTNKPEIRSIDGEEITLLTKAFYYNDPYFPRPAFPEDTDGEDTDTTDANNTDSTHADDDDTSHTRSSREGKLWNAFQSQYLYTSTLLIRHHIGPTQFIYGVEKEDRRRRGGGDWVEIFEE